MTFRASEDGAARIRAAVWKLRSDTRREKNIYIVGGKGDDYCSYSCLDAGEERQRKNKVPPTLHLPDFKGSHLIGALHQVFP